MRSTCAAVPARATFSSRSSVSGAATRVTARTLEYDSSPRAKAPARSGNVPRARATRTFSRAAPRSSPTRQLNQAAEYFELASYQPDAPPQARRFAAFARQNGGNLVVSYELWSEVYRTTKNVYLRETALLEMGKITQAIETGREELARRRLGTPRVLFNAP